MYFVEPFYLIKFFLWKSINDNKNDHFFSIPHLSLNNIDLIVYQTLTRMAANKTHSALVKSVIDFEVIMTSHFQ